MAEINLGRVVGKDGARGPAFTYEDFTEEQLARLKGERGERGPQGFKGDKGECGEKGDSVEIVQTSGTSEMLAMSQKAVTDFVNKKVKVTPISNNGKLTSLSFADTKVDTLIIIALAGGNCEFKLIDGENKALYSHWDPAFIFIEVTAGGSKYTAIFYDGTIKTDYTNIAKHTYRFSSIVGTIYEISRGEL